jgi:hypothetical protein
MATQGLAGGGRDAFNHAADIRQLAYLGAPERYVFLGYRYDYDDPVNAAGNAYGYHASEGSGGAGWSFPQAIDAELSYAYRYEHYGSASAQQFPPTGSRRHDGEHEVFAAVSKALNTRFAITAAYLGTFNNSSKPVFDYDRHIVSLALQMRFY